MWHTMDALSSSGLADLHKSALIVNAEGNCTIIEYNAYIGITSTSISVLRGRGISNAFLL